MSTGGSVSTGGSSVSTGGSSVSTGGSSVSAGGSSVSTGGSSVSTGTGGSGERVDTVEEGPHSLVATMSQILKAHTEAM